MSKWVGYAVSVNCGDPLGCYQGTILEADGTTITLTKAFRNGYPYPECKVTLNAADIKSLKIIEYQSEPSKQTHSTVAVTKSNKKCPRSTVCENLQANPTSSTTGNAGIGNNKPTSARASGPGLARSKPIDIQGNKPNKNINHIGSYSNTGTTPKGRGSAGASAPHARARRRNEACFGDEAEPFDDEFDFESNLALFDKRAEWERLRGARPDLVRHADDAAKFRHDENVLGGAARRPGLRVPEHLRGPLDYVTDEGATVPSAAPALRAALWEGLARCGLAESAALLLARATADVCLRLVGGGRRLEARNAHQPPTVVALAGPHRVGASALAAARLLASHGARVAYHLTPSPPPATVGLCPDLYREAQALALNDVLEAGSLERLPSPDLVLVALYDPALDDPQEGIEDVVAWANAARAAVVAVEPPGEGGGGGAAGAWGAVSARASVCACWPGALAGSLGRVYLADVAPPLRLFKDLYVEYRPPFGASSVLALHAAGEAAAEGGAAE